MPHKISIALATYNGADYLPDFLDSLLYQEQLPVELIACDDASDDGTVGVLEFFIRKAPFTVKVFQNPKRLGVTGNFSHAISLCTCDVIALADQDDVWQPGKLKQVSQAMISSDREAVFSNAQVVAEDLRPLGYTMWQRVDFNQREQARMVNGQSLDVLLKHRVVTGATLAFRKDLRDLLLPIPSQWPHDAWIATLAAVKGGLYPINKTLVNYRQHRGNVIGGQKKSLWEEMRIAKELDRQQWYQEEIERLQSLGGRLESLHVSNLIRDKLNGKILHLETRLTLPKHRFKRLPAIVKEIVSGRYAAYSRNWGSIAIDLLIR